MTAKNRPQRFSSSEDNFGSLLELFPDIVYRLDGNCKLSYLNAFGYGVLGLEPSEVIGQSIVQWIHPEDRLALLDAFDELKQFEKKILAVNARIVSKSAATRHFIHYIGILRDANGNVAGIQGIAKETGDSQQNHESFRGSRRRLDRAQEKRDSLVESQMQRIHQGQEEAMLERTGEDSQSNRTLPPEIAERARMEDRLRASEQRFRSAFANAAVGMALTRTDGHFLEVNRVLCEITGYSEAELLDRTFQSITYTGDLETTDRDLKDLLAGEIEDYEVEKRYVHKQGHHIWVQLSTSLVRDEAGCPLYFVSLMQDITERKGFEEEVKESENRFRTLFNNAQDAVIVHDLPTRCSPGCLIEANSVACERLGYTREELLKMTPLDYIPEDRHGEVPGIIASLREKGHSRFEIENITKSGVRIPVEINSHILQMDGRDVVLSISRDITERKKMEERLRESEERYRRLVEVSPDPIAVHTDGNLVFVNAAALELLGADSLDQVVGRPMMDFVHHGYRHLVDQRVNKMMGEQSRVSMIEEKFLRLDGTPIDVEVAATSLTYMGKPSMLVIAHDITGRKKAEEDLRQALEESRRRSAETEALLKSARAVLEGQEFVDSARVVFESAKQLTGARAGLVAMTFGEEPVVRLMVVDMGQIHEGQEYGPAHPFRELVGYGIEQGKAFCVNDLLHSQLAAHFPQEHARIENLLLAPITLKGQSVGLIILANKQGGFDEDDVRMAVAFGEVASVAYQNSVTLESLEKSEEHFRSAVQTAYDAVISTNASREIVYWNNAAAKLFGYSAEEILGQKLDLVIPARFFPDYKFAWERMAKTGIMGLSEKPVEISGVRKDGTEVPLELSVQAWKTREGTFFTGIVRDTTERKRMEEQLRRAQRLETAGRIAGQVAHDFNNLLSPLVGYPELIKMELPEGHQAAQICDAMVKAAEQMADINEDLMALGRRGHFSQEPVDINRLLGQAISQMLNRPERLVIETDLAEDLLPANGATAQLLRVVSNLLSNSREAMQDSGTLRIKTENVYIDEPFGRYNRIEVGEYVRLDVADTGCGISDEIRDKVFDAFFTTRRSGKIRGSGLGLSVVQAIMDDHRGYVDFESVPGKGTTFSLYLPVNRDAQKGTKGRDVQRGSESILIVDDDDVQRDLLKRLLESQGYKVGAVDLGENAVAYLGEHKTDLVVLDMIMPGIDGTETYRRILEINPNQQAIILSGFAESDRVKEAQKLGAGAFVRKPVTLTKLARAVRDELDRQTARRSPIQPQ